MTYYALVLVAVLIGIHRARQRILQVEGPSSRPPDRVAARARWSSGPAIERAAFIVAGISIVVWLLGILFVGTAAAMAALTYAVWRRPYLGRDLAEVAIGLGAVSALLVGGFGEGIGARLANASIVGLPWLVVGFLLLRADKKRDASIQAPTTDRNA